METNILLVRHPETLANVDGRFIGRGNAALTAEGRRQMRRIPAKIAAFAPDAIWTSPLARAFNLAQASGRAAGVAVGVDERLVELDFGDVEGMTFEEITAAGIRFNYKNLETPVAPNGESRGQIERRAAAFCDELMGREGRFAVVTHGGVFRASLVHLLGLSSTDIWAFHIHNGQLAHIRIADGHGMLEEYRQG